MHAYIKQQKDAKKLNDFIQSYQNKLDQKVNEVVSHMMNYSYKINDFALPEIPNKKINTTTAKSTYRSKPKSKSKSITDTFLQSFDTHNAQTLLASFKQNKFKKPVQLQDHIDHNKGRSMGSQKYQKPKLYKRQPEILPRQIRLNPFSEKNAIKAHELDKGMLSLIERGKIAKNIDIITAFEKGRPVLESHPAIFHHAEEKFTQSDLQKHNQTNKFIHKEILEAQKQQNWSMTIPQITRRHHIKRNEQFPDKKLTNRSSQSQLQQYKQPEIIQVLHLQFLHYKVVENQNYLSFKRGQVLIWNQMRTLIKEMEKFLKSANAELVYVDCNKLLLFINKCKKIQEKQLISCIVQRKNEKLGTIMSVKNRQQKLQIAKNMMLSFVKRIKIRRKYIDILLKRKVQKNIGQWLNNGAAIKQYRRNLEKYREETFEKFEEQQKTFKQNYETIASAKHYEIRIMNKQFMQGFKYEQIYNTEIASIFNLENPNTHIIYVCPFELTLETMNYYFKIMELQQIQGYKEKVLFMEVDPDSRLPQNLQTSAKLFYNSKSLRKLQRKIKGVPSYFVISYPSQVDIKMSVFMNVPIYSGNIQTIPTTKSSLQDDYGMQMLSSLKIQPKSTNIVSICNLIMKFCSSNKMHNKYVLKINSKYGSAGLALVQFPFSSLPEMYSNTTLVQSYYFQTVDRFYSALIKYGGIVQRFEDGIQAITVSAKISSKGEWTVLGTFDKISAGLVNVAYIFPQKVVNHKLLLEKVKPVFEKLIEFGHMGNVQLTLYKNASDRLYLQNVQLYSTKVGSSLIYFKFLSGGYLNSAGEFMTKINEEDDEQQSEEQQLVMMEQRTFCYIPFLLHFGLSEKQIGSFFQLCRIGGVSFDLENKFGSTFVLLGSMKSSLGIISTAKERKATIKILNKALEFLLKQNSHNLSDEMLKEKELRIKERYNIVSIKEKLQTLL